MMRKVKTFHEFRMISEDKSGTNYEYGCLMLYVDIPNWENFTKEIEKIDLYRPENERYGLEKDPHITILYGIHKDVDDDQVISMFSDLTKNDFDIFVNGIDCFHNDEFDVLKLNLESSELIKLNKLARLLNHTNNFPTYDPHLTIAYLNKGMGNKYSDTTFHTKINNINKIVYSKTNGEKIFIPIN